MTDTVDRTDDPDTILDSDDDEPAAPGETQAEPTDEKPAGPAHQPRTDVDITSASSLFDL